MFVPAASNYIPIRRALSKTLKDSLDIYHRTISDFTVRIMKLAELGISPAQTIAALTLVVLGFVAYYIAPDAFVFQNLPLFFFIMTSVLMMLIMGFMLLLNLLQPPSEKVILKIILAIYHEDRALETVIVKNLDSHRNRNTKTSLMFGIALSFLIFAGTAFRLNASLIIDQAKSGLGSDIVVKSIPTEKSYLKEYEIREALQQYRKDFPKVIREFAFASLPFSRQPEIPRMWLSPLAGSPSCPVEPISVDPDFLEACYDDYYLPIEYDKSVKLDWLMKTNKLNGVQGLYKNDGLDVVDSYDKYKVTSNAYTRTLPELSTFFGEREIKILIPSGLALGISADVGTPALLEVGDTKFRARIRSSAQKFPGFFFTGYRVMWKINVITSHEDFRYIRDKVYEKMNMDQRQKTAINKYKASIPVNTTDNVPKLHLMVKLQDGVDRETRLGLFNTIQTLVDGQFSFVVDVVETTNSIQANLIFIDIFFVLVSVISISLSFFFTLVSFMSNISESSWEFGILRAVGLNKEQMVKIYVFEALCIIVAAGILGTMAGIIVALTTTLQFNLFTELPFRFLFPTFVFLITITLSVLTSIFGSKAAVDDIKDKQIATIIKALD